MRPSDMPVRLEIRNPQDVIVKLVESVKTDTGFITETFHFPPHPLFGNWSVVGYHGHKVSFTWNYYFLYNTCMYWKSSTCSVYCANLTSNHKASLFVILFHVFLICTSHILELIFCTLINTEKAL